MRTFRNTHHLCLILNASDFSLESLEASRSAQDKVGDVYGQFYVTTLSVMRGCLEEVGYKDLVRN